MSTFLRSFLFSQQISKVLLIVPGTVRVRSVGRTVE